MHELTQKDAALQFEMSQPALCDYERGKKVPRIDAALRIARATDNFVPVESWASEAKEAS